MFLDDDFGLQYIYIVKKSYIENLIEEFRSKTGEYLSYKQSINKDIDALHQTEHKSKKFINRRKIQKIEYIRYKFKKYLIIHNNI